MSNYSAALDQADFPETAKDFIRLIGWSRAIKLIREMPGNRFYVSADKERREDDKSFQKLSEIVGLKAARTIFDAYKGTTIEIPSCRSAFVAARNRTIRAAFDSGESIGQICQQTRLSRRTIFYVLKEMP